MTLQTTRRAVLALAALSLAPAARAACPPPKVLFVCPAGTVKSAIAREELRRLAAARGVAVEAWSRCLRPEDHVSPALAANLARDNLRPGVEPTRALAAEDIARADIIVAFDAAAEAPGLGKARRWNTPSWNSDYAAAKADLGPRLDGLLAEVERRGCR